MVVVMMMMVLWWCSEPARVRHASSKKNRAICVLYFVKLLLLEEDDEKQRVQTKGNQFTVRMLDCVSGPLETPFHALYNSGFCVEVLQEPLVAASFIKQTQIRVDT